MSLNKPSDFFERKKDEELARKKLKEEQELANKKVAAPKKYFGEEEEIVEIVEEVKPKAKPDPLAKIREDLKTLSKSIPEKTDLSEVFGRIEELKERIDNIPGQVSYEGHINVLRAEITEVEESIPEQFDPTDLYNNLSSLKENIERVRSEIPIIPEPILYDDELNKITELVEEVRNSIPEVPEVRYYEKELNLIIDSIEQVREEIPVIPEIKYYDDQISDIEKGIKLIEKSISKLPKVKYYDKQIKEILESVKEVRSEIPEVPEVPEIKYYDEDIKDLKEQISSVEGSIPTVPEVKYYDEDIKGINKEIRGLYKKYTSIKIPDQEQYILEAKNLYSSFEKKNQKLQKKIDHLEEVFSKFNEEVLIENTLSIPPDEDNSDPLTPLDQKFVTYEKLQENYRLFVNRVQQQLASFGGGGIGDAPYDGQAYVRKNFKWVLSSSAGGGGAGLWQSDSVGINTTSNIGVGADAVAGKRLYVSGDAEFTGNVSVGGTLTYEDVKNVDSIGVITARQDVRVGQNLSVVGLTTLGSANGIGTVHVGLGNTALYVDGDARIVGVLTVGRSSVTIDGNAETVSVGIVTITNATVNIGENVRIDSIASGINSAPNVLYVAKDGDDDNNGTSIDNAFLSIKAAVGIAQSGTTIKILSGRYQEVNPIEVPAFVSIVGDDQRTVTVTPINATSNIFHVRKASKLANMTFTGHLSPSSAVAFPTDEIAENVGGGKWKGPYIQNCTSDTTTGTGLYVDGDQARLLASMNVDSYTQYNQGGVGVAITNSGFAQLVSLFTICTNEAVTCDKGGQADIANSNCSFGTFGLVSRGVSDLQYTGVVTTTAEVSTAEVTVNVSTPTLNISNFVYDNISGIATVTTSSAHKFQVGMGVTLSNILLSCPFGQKTYPEKRPFVFDVDSIPSTTSFIVNVGVSTLVHTYVSGGTVKIDVDRPYDGQLVFFDRLYKSVNTISVGSGGTGYTATPSITIDSPAGPNGETATAFATLEGDSVASITIISSGSQYETTPSITISAPEVGSNTATGTANMEDLYYTINSSTPVTAGITTLNLATNLLNSVGVGSTTFFSQGSRIVASSHTFEYVGSGNQIVTATPKRGGVTNQENEVVTLDGGKVLYTSTDQAGNFRIGDDLQINQETGTISGRSFSKSLFSEMTPFILALS